MNDVLDTNIPESLQNKPTSPNKPIIGYSERTWLKPVELLTKQEKSWMWKTDRRRAVSLLLTPKAAEGTRTANRQRKLAKLGRTELVMPENMSGIDAINKQLLNAINDKYKEANILDIAKTMEILSGIKAKEIKDAMELQARNYTPTVITQAPEKDKSDSITEPIDKPEIDNTIDIDTNTENLQAPN